MDTSNRVNFSSCAFWSFSLSIALLPIGLAGDRPIPLGLCQLGLAFSTLCLCFNPKALMQTPLFARLKWALILLALVTFWAFLQTQSFLPQSWAHPLWHETSLLLGQPVAASISVVPEESLRGLMRLLSYITGGILAYIVTQDSKRAHQLITTLWATGTGICLYGIVIFLAGNEQILWFNKWAYLNDLTATFVNRNHFAIYTGFLLIIGTALLIHSWRKMMRGQKSHQRIAAIRHWIIYQGLPRITLIILTFICLVLSHSRAGLVWSLIGLGSFVILYQIYLRSWFRFTVTALIFALIFGFTLFVALETSDRFSVLFEDFSSQERSQVYDITWHAIKDNLWLGYGLGGFEPEFRLYQQNMYQEFNHAHSDLLESLLDLGIVGAGLLWAAITLLLSGLWHGIRHRRHNGLYPTIALASSMMILGHATVDFDLQIPGVVFTWVALLGVGLAQSWQQVEKESEVKQI